MIHQNKIKYFSWIAPAVGINKLLKRLESDIIFPFYHTVSDDFLPYISELYSYKNTDQFKKDLEYLLKNFTPVSVEDIIKGKLKKGKKYFMLSFDDGMKECKTTIAPILKEKGIPAAFFINPSYIDDKEWMYRYEVSTLIHELKNLPPSDSSSCTIIKMRENEILKHQDTLRKINYQNREKIDEIMERMNLNRTALKMNKRIYLSTDELKSLADDGFHIGAHSINHPPFSEITKEQQLKEIKGSFDELEKIVPLKYRSFAFPFSDDGLDNKRIEELQKQKGLHISFGTSGYGKAEAIMHYQRIPMEHNKIFSSDKIISSELFSAYIKKTLLRK